MSRVAPRRIGFDALYDALGSEQMRFSERAKALSGSDVLITGFLTAAHDDAGRMVLTDAPGVCPDCSPAPAAAVYLPGFAARIAATRGAVRLVGRLEFGFEIDAAGNATFLRLHNARIATGLPVLAALATVAITGEEIAS